MQDPKAVMLVLGSEWLYFAVVDAGQTQAPTWNYASAQFFVDVEFFEQPEAIEAHLRESWWIRWKSRCRARRQRPHGKWTTWARVMGSGPTRHRLTREGPQRARQVQLGQDERDDVFADIMTGLTGRRAPELHSWMREFNPPPAETCQGPVARKKGIDLFFRAPEK